MKQTTRPWACILGGTGGFGLAAAERLAEDGFNLILIFRERKSSLAAIESRLQALKENTDVLFFNGNINEFEHRQKVIDTLVARRDCSGKVSFLLHAIADGNLRPLFGKGKPELIDEDFVHTIRAMGLGLQQWTKLLLDNKLLAKKASVCGLTSEGAWRFFKDYAAVAAAKAVLESNVRYMAVELAATGIRVNLINAGITDTAALHVFPDYAKFIAAARKRNPSGRLTSPEDVARAISFFASPDSSWITGSVLRVDGGEQLISLY